MLADAVDQNALGHEQGGAAGLRALELTRQLDHARGGG